MNYSNKVLSNRALTVIHMHIMKTAGMTLNHKISERFPIDRNVFNNQDKVGGYPSILSAKKNFDILAHDFDYITGHFHYTMLKRIKKAKTLQGNYVVDFTILRDPIQRSISIYNYYIKEFYINSSQALKYHGRKMYELFIEKKVGFDEFIDLAPCHINNFQTRFLSDLDSRLMWDANPPEINNQIFDNAKKNLDTFSLIGIQEEIDGFWKCLCYLCGWKYKKLKDKINYSKLDDYHDIPEHMMNVSINILSNKTIEKIEKKSYFDKQLYEYAQKIYMSQLNEIIKNFEK